MTTPDFDPIDPTPRAEQLAAEVGVYLSGVDVGVNAQQFEEYFPDLEADLLDTTVVAAALTKHGIVVDVLEGQTIDEAFNESLDKTQWLAEELQAQRAFDHLQGTGNESDSNNGEAQMRAIHKKSDILWLASKLTDVVHFKGQPGEEDAYEAFIDESITRTSKCSTLTQEERDGILGALEDIIGTETYEAFAVRVFQNGAFTEAERREVAYQMGQSLQRGVDRRVTAALCDEVMDLQRVNHDSWGTFVVSLNQLCFAVIENARPEVIARHTQNVRQGSGMLSITEDQLARIFKKLNIPNSTT